MRVFAPGERHDLGFHVSQRLELREHFLDRVAREREDAGLGLGGV